VLERLRAASVAQDVERSAALYAEDAVHGRITTGS
jgi:ketosteroid isomerase-like protein